MVDGNHTPSAGPRFPTLQWAGWGSQSGEMTLELEWLAWRTNALLLLLQEVEIRLVAPLHGVGELDPDV